MNLASQQVNELECVIAVFSIENFHDCTAKIHNQAGLKTATMLMTYDKGDFICISNLMWL
jgi:hypothetical protein